MKPITSASCVVLSLIASATIASRAAADIKLPAIFADRMVLQQKELATFWGTADPGESITANVTWTATKYTTTADATGHWELKFKAPRAGIDHTIRLVAKNEVVLHDVSSGEVWLCSGQSNMEMPVGDVDGYAGVANFQLELKHADQTGIVVFNIKNTISATPLADCTGRWTLCDAETARHTSATAYFFARKLYQELQVPIGIIEADWGGTPVEAWTSAASLMKLPEFQKSLSALAQIAEHKPAGGEHDPAINPNMPTVLYNGMIAPIVPYRFRGVLWYQGEANRSHAHDYQKLFPGLIADWRDHFGQGDLPFYFVQIAPFGYEGDKGEAAELREAQTMTLSVPNTGMAVTMDIGDARDIHPKNKQDVGRRLARIALANVYEKKDVEASGPMYKSMKIEGSSIRLSFNHAHGLTSKDKPLAHFTIAAADQKFVSAQAVIDGETVVVSSDAVKEPVAVRYGWGAADAGTLFNAGNLPAPSFRTDTWKGVTETSAVLPRRTLDMHNGILRLPAPNDRWDEGAPLGNGLLGVLVWGEGKTLKLSLDRGDLWDLVPAETTLGKDWNYSKMKELVASHDEATFRELFDVPYDTVVHPTKIPAGRIEITTEDPHLAQGLVLIPNSGMVTGGGFHVFASSKQPVVMAMIPDGPKKIEIVRPTGLDKLGCKPATFGSDKSTQWMVQEAPGDLTYAIVVGKGDGRLYTSGSDLADPADALEHMVIAVAITSTNDGKDPLELGKARVAQALAEGFYRLQAVEEKRREAFANISRVSVPDASIQAHYDLAKYYYGSASRPGAPPIPLQGVWTADEGGLPPWKGDYHNDLNTQMTYLAYPTAGLFDAGKCWIDFNLKLLPRYERFAHEFYGVDGAVVPGVMALDGTPLGGWGMYSLSPTNGAWIAQSFYLHWRYTMDEGFLRAQAYPWCAEIGTALLAIAKPDANGKLKLPLSSSPEIHDNSLRAWLQPNSNYDLALMRWLFASLAEMADAQKIDTDASKWRDALAKLDSLDVDDSGSLTFAKGEPYGESHRHFSHAVAIHPLGIVSIDGGEGQRRMVNATLDRIESKGTSQWCGYSFAWFSCMLARAGRAEEALAYLENFVQGFVLRNGFHCNGDQSGTGLSSFTYRPFTLEGNFLGMQAVHEMLLQSWGGLVRVFPAVSQKWRDVSFKDLRAEGGFRVSAERKNGRTVQVGVAAEKNGTLRIKDPFDSGCSVAWSGAHDVKSKDGVYAMTMAKGDSVLAMTEMSRH